MRFGIMDKVVIASDTFAVDAPVGEVAFIAKVDRTIDTGQPYCVRVPSRQTWWWMPECDLMTESEWTDKVVDSVIKTSLVNHSLDTGNKELFLNVMRGMNDAKVEG